PMYLPTFLKRAAGPLVAVIVLTVAFPAFACSVPVYRYALERWDPDSYLVMIYHKGPLDAELKAIVDKAKAAAAAEPNYANIEVETIDLDSKMDKFQQQVWDGQDKDVSTPWMVVRYPFQSRIDLDLWKGKPSLDVLERFIDSPARREIARRILKGQTAVWVMLECADEDQNDAAAALLDKESKRLKDVLQLPVLEEEDRQFISEDAPDLKIEFSLVRISRTDPKEAMFVRMLMNCESGLEEYVKEPIVFPVFGRGRALWAITGKGLSRDTVEEAGGFLCGACSCQIKNQNPGVDLLMAAGWRSFVHEGYVVDEELPPLVGLPDPEVLAMAVAPPAPQDPLLGEADANSRVANAGVAMTDAVAGIPPAVNSTSPALTASTSVKSHSSTTSSTSTTDFRLPLLPTILTVLGVGAVLVLGFALMMKPKET
ncbi:MAG: hypothetical protein N2C14_21355, partial [Planctomycetales bacterium]